MAFRDVFIRDFCLPVEDLQTHNFFQRGNILTPTKIFNLISFKINLSVDILEQEVKVEFSSTDPDTSLEGSTILDDGSSKTFSVPFSSWEKHLGHDFVFSILEGSTDTSLNVITEGEPGLDDLTPDALHQFGQNFALVEFGTTRSTQNRSNINDYQIKQYKYATPFEARLDLRTQKRGERSYGKIIVIIVNPNFVVCGEYLHDNIVNELILRKRISESMFEKMRDLGYTRITDESHESEAEVSRILQSIPLKFGTNPNEFTKEDYNSLHAPTNKGNLSQIFNTCMRETKEYLMKPPTSKSYNKYVEKAKSGDRRVCMKPVSNIPLFLVKLRSGNNIIRQFTDKRNAMERLIHECFASSSYEEENVEELLRRARMTYHDAKDIEKEAKSFRHKYRRCTAKLNESDKLELAAKGISGKRYEKDLKPILDEKKKALSFDCNIEDITEDINGAGKLLLKENEYYNHPCQNDYLNLIKKAISDQNVNSETEIETLKSLLHTKGFEMSTIITSIGVELSLSLTQHTKKDEYILKRLRGYDIYLLIKTTNSDSHIFFSIIVPEDSYIECNLKSFRQFFKSGDVYYTNFVSVDATRITNLVNMNSSFLTMCADLARWSGLKFEALSKPQEIDNKLFLNHLAFRFMIHMENKACSEVAATQWRYIVMKSCQQLHNDEGPWLTYSSHETTFRSRLQIWIQKRQKEALELMINTRPRLNPHGEGFQDELIDRYSGLIDYISMENLKGMPEMVETFYLGYESDKNKAFHDNAGSILVAKIAEEELKYDDVDHSYEGREDHLKDKPKPHEFSISVVRAMSDAIVDELKRTMGEEWQKQISSEIKRSLAEVSHLDLATLKATSKLTKEHEKLSLKATTKKRQPEDKNTPKRKKTIIMPEDEIDIPKSKLVKEVSSMLNNMDDKEKRSRPIDLIPKFLNDLEEDGSLRIYIFPKNQVGGPREIYVMRQMERYPQYMIELISRVICSKLEMETMSTPENKDIIPAMHFSKSKPYMDDNNTVLLYSSNDATRWNQRLVVKSFTILLCRILPKEFHGFIVRLLNMWTKKKIMLPKGIQQFLVACEKYENRDNKLSNLLLEGFRGSNERLLDKASRMLKIQTGMMQGILHFTSSLFHTGLLLLHKKLFLDSALSLKGNDPVILISSMCSSDDSGSMITVKSSSKGKSFVVCQMFLNSIRYLGEYVSIYDSEKKSAKGLKNLLEFNSVWYSCGSIIKPTNKWSMSCLTIPTSSSILARQEHFSNLLTQLLESGAPFKQLFLTQCAQALLHYNLLGLTCHALFPHFQNGLLFIPDPNIGFFLMDNPLIAGLMGFKYNLFISITHNEEVRKRISYHLNNDRVEMTPDGSITTAASVRFGPLTKYKRFVRECEPDFDWRYEYEENPELLFRKPNTIREEICKIMSKLTSSGVPDTFTNTQKTSRSIAASVYLLSHHSIFMKYNKSVKDTLDGIETNPREKFSLIQLVEKNYENTDLSKQQMEWLFPTSELFECIEGHLKDEYECNIEIENYKFKKGRSNFIINKQDQFLLTDLNTLVRWRWFGLNLKYHRRTLEDSWARAKIILPWLRDTCKETKEEGKFDSYQELAAIVQQVSFSTRKVHLTSVPIRSKEPVSMMLELLKKNQWPGTVLRRTDRRPSSIRLKTHILDGISEELKRIAHKIYLILNFPLTHAAKTVKIKRLMREEINFELDLSLMPSIPKDLCSLALMCYVSKREGLKMKGLPMEWLERTKDSIVGGYETRQKYNNSKKCFEGTGIWVGKIKGLSVRLHIKDDFLTQIETESIKMLCLRSYQLKTWCETNKITVKKGKMGLAGYYYDGKQIKHEMRSSNVPIKEMKIDVNRIIDLECSIEVSPDRPTIRVVTREHREFTTLCSYTLSLRNFIYRDVTQKTSGIFDSWLRQRPMNLKGFLRFIKTIRKVEFSNETPLSFNEDIKRCEEWEEDSLITQIQDWHFDKSKVKTWAATCLDRSLRKIGYHKAGIMESSILGDNEENPQNDLSILRTEAVTPETDYISSYDFALLDEMILNFEDDPAADRSIVIPEPQIEEGEYEFNIEEFAYDASKSRRREETLLKDVHPFLKNTASQSSFGRTWWREVLSGKLQESSPESAENIAWLFGISLKRDTSLDDSEEFDL